MILTYKKGVLYSKIINFNILTFLRLKEMHAFPEPQNQRILRENYEISNV